jgi:hypothetical protein
MSPTARRTCAAALLVVLLARPALALLDPVETGLLAKISALLATIQRIQMEALEKWNRQISVRLGAYAFPKACSIRSS